MTSANKKTQTAVCSQRRPQPAIVRSSRNKRKPSHPSSYFLPATCISGECSKFLTAVLLSASTLCGTVGWRIGEPIPSTTATLLSPCLAALHAVALPHPHTPPVSSSRASYQGSDNRPSNNQPSNNQPSDYQLQASYPASYSHISPKLDCSLPSPSPRGHPVTC